MKNIHVILLFVGCSSYIETSEYMTSDGNEVSHIRGHFAKKKAKSENKQSFAKKFRYVPALDSTSLAREQIVARAENQISLYRRKQHVSFEDNDLRGRLKNTGSGAARCNQQHNNIQCVLKELKDRAILSRKSTGCRRLD